MIFRTIDKKALLFINKNNLITLFIYTFLIFTIYNLVNDDLDDVLGKEKEQPLVYDKNIKITLFTEDLNFPTGIDFLGENDMLVIEKITGQVKRILNNEIMIDTVLVIIVASKS